MSLYSCSNWTKLINKINNHCLFCLHFVGIAVVTETKAALWTDGRYYLQAESQLDSNWLLMKDGNDIWWNVYSVFITKRQTKWKKHIWLWLFLNKHSFENCNGHVSVITLFSALMSQLLYKASYGYGRLIKRLVGSTYGSSWYDAAGAMQPCWLQSALTYNNTSTDLIKENGFFFLWFSRVAKYTHQGAMANWGILIKMLEC